jgi:hypothetical protein
LVARDIEVEFVNFGRSLPQMLDATSTSKSTCRRKIEMSPGVQSRDDIPVWAEEREFACIPQLQKSEQTGT